jgi:glycosyltransferase involved in cell wall biosynthesis
MVTVVIPTYNRADLIPIAVESALAQTYRELEIIVVDDGSTDDTATRLNAYAKHIRYVRQANGGVSAARNHGVKLARGSWISFLDSDDVWDPLKLESQLSALRELGKEFGVCFTDTILSSASADRSAFEAAGFRPEAPVDALHDVIDWVLAPHPIIWIQSTLIRREALDAVGGFDETLRVSEDTDILFRLALRTKFCFVAKALVRIDQAPSRSHLMDLFREAAALEIRERRHRKWLAMPELMDPALRTRLERDLRGVYYQRVIIDLYAARLRNVIRDGRHLHALGDSYATIATTLFHRALRQVTSRFRT